MLQFSSHAYKLHIGEFIEESNLGEDSSLQQQ